MMTTNGLYEDDLERKQHLHAIHTLAEGVRISPIEVSPVYEDVLRAYKKEARVKIYLSILVTKKVRDILDHTRNLS